MALRRLVPWLLIALMAVFGIYYLMGGAHEDAMIAPAEPAPRAVTARTVPPPPAETVSADTPSEAVARDAVAAVDQMKDDQQREIEAMKPEPTMDGSMMMSAPMKSDKP